MMVWGKIVGGLLGLLITGPAGLGLLGLLFGVYIGHRFDQGLHRLSGMFNPGLLLKHGFFEATFSLMGHIAKADGHISKNEIQAAEAIMRHMQLSKEQRRQAIAHFQRGKRADFNLQQTIAQFHRYCHPSLYRLFMDIQWQAAQADGPISAQKQSVLNWLCEQLGQPGFSHYQYQYQHNTQSQRTHGQSQRTHNTQHALQAAYQTLGLSTNATFSEVKRAYHRLMREHHPDKLAAKGLPESMRKLATEKTQTIQAAYQTIKNAQSQQA